jgi:hypothetical protein
MLVSRDHRCASPSREHQGVNAKEPEMLEKNEDKRRHLAMHMAFSTTETKARKKSAITDG